jgi:peptide/nickel transport system ATP-binding protein
VRTLLEVRDAAVRYRRHGSAPVVAVDGVGLSLQEGEILGLVGESGCGKTSLGRAILRLVPLASGEIRWEGRRIDTLSRRAFQPLRREMQIVFQDPHASFDPRMTVAESVAEPLRTVADKHDAAARGTRAESALAEVGLSRDLGERYPHQLSGGQLQRAGIARALVVEPRFVVWDEPVSALDVSVQGQVVNLLARIRRDRQLAGLFISHNLAVVARLAERILVMFRGRIVESAPREALLRTPRHPYTRLLLDSVPDPDPGAAGRVLERARAPSRSPAAESVSGCAFASRCPWVEARCRQLAPALQPAGEVRLVACHRADEWPSGLASSIVPGAEAHGLSL